MIQICAVGGYNEVGKNMTAVKVDDEVVIIDMGLQLDNYIRYTEQDEDELVELSAHDLARVGAIPNDSVIKDWRTKVKAIVPTHAHLDHVGALIFLANKYDAPILCTPFTAEVIKAISRDERIKLKNEIKILNVNSHYKLSENITIEFINMTHSTPQTVMVAIHSKQGTIIYANDFKFDNHPTIGKKPNYERLAELGKQGVKALICDCTRAKQPIKTPSELVAKEMLRDVMLGVDSKGKTVIVTTFASHLARLKSIIEFGKKMNRKIVFLGRSLAKYSEAGENIGLVNFSKEAEIVRFGKQIKKRLQQIQKDGTSKYLLVVTGHQGEPKSTLSKIVTGKIPFKFNQEDHVIFSCTVIPSEINIRNRAELEKGLRAHGVRIFRDIHTSGHASKEDLRDLLNLVNPENIIPAHGDDEMKQSLVDLAIEKGYKKGKTVHLIHDGDKLSF
ncbi:MAG: RNase J family beta-CASP ribonuclease [Nanoarchaeota archaeon]|nr:RNase J family beta-CASP ribonuclease [Nanoarchaeota archaeon]MBU1004683.1 RNase J family beta-CASP ribonuclease [Nanoarchaeota archaeon]MBU1945808.1 RNase J family beta-CASP ribonuclease [Nanoarchaeota archaeon]